MKKIKLPILFFIISLSSYYTFPQQKNSIGIYAGMDFYTIEQLEKSFRLVDLTEVSIKRQSFSNPFLIGINYEHCFENLLALQIYLEGIYLTYFVEYRRNDPQPFDPFYIKISDYNVPWARITFGSNLMKTIPLNKSINFFAGLGAGLFIMAPVVSDNFIYNTLLNKFQELDLSDDIKLRYSPGGQLISGITLNPFNLPINLKIAIKYSLTTKGEYEEPYSILSSYLNINYNF